jgi:diguanylate cyclase (GGDEF)-like protein
MPLETLAGFQLMLYGFAWALAAWLIPEARRVLVHWSAYALLQAASTWAAAGALMNGGVTPAAALALSVLGFAAAVRGVDVFASTRPGLDAWMAAVLALCLPAIVAAPFIARTREAGQAWQHFSYGAGVAAMLLGSTPSLWRRLRREHGRPTSLTALAPGAAVGMLAALSAILDLTLGMPAMHAARDATRVPALMATLATSAVFNFAYLFLFMARVIGRLRDSAQHDELTKSFNRRKIESVLDIAWRQHARTRCGLCVAVIDVDHFKRINDRHGHAAGDKALVFVARTLREHTRAYDSVGRWGGEEFILVMPGVAQAQAMQTCERLRQVLANASPASAGVALTASFGVAVADGCEPSAAALVARADAAMYRAKRAGRNRVCLGRSGALSPEGGRTS